MNLATIALIAFMSFLMWYMMRNLARVSRQYGESVVFTFLVNACKNADTVQVMHGGKQWKMLVIEMDEGDPNWETAQEDGTQWSGLMIADSEEESTGI